MYWEIGVAAGWLFMFFSIFLLTFKKGRTFLLIFVENSIVEDMLLGRWGYNSNSGIAGCIGVGAFICVVFMFYAFICAILSCILIVVWPLLLFSTIIGFILNKREKK